MDLKLEKEKICSLQKEKRLIILLSRLTFSDEIIGEISEILQDKNFNWFKFYQYVLYHKVVTLCWSNLKNMSVKTFQPKYAREMINAMYLALKEKNSMYQKEIANIVKKCNSQYIKVIPVKGAILIPQLYKDYGLRYSGDMDFLVRYEDLKMVEKILEIEGYITGKVSYKDKKIIPISRREDIKWKTFMSNSHPLVKLSETELFPVYKIDFRFALSDDLRKESVNEIIESYTQSGFVKPAHYLIHLCTHFYDEAKHTADIAVAKDMNLIKLCDIREYILQLTQGEDLKELVCFAKRYGLEKQVYFTMIYLLIIYDDGYEEKILEKLDIKDESFLYTFGDNTLKDTQRNDISVAERLFACGKMKEQISTPKLYL